jgi:putative transcription antitermination factor YqgF
VTLTRGRDAVADGAAITALLRAHDVTELIVGLPYEAAGQEGTQAALTREWVAAVTPHLPSGTVLSFQDERLSSHLAEQRLGPMKRGRSGGPPSRSQRDAYRARVDREAAAIILQDALDTRRAPGSSPTRPPTTTEIPS